MFDDFLNVRVCEASIQTVILFSDRLYNCRVTLNKLYTVRQSNLG